MSLNSFKKFKYFENRIMYGKFKNKHLSFGVILKYLSLLDF